MRRSSLGIVKLGLSKVEYESIQNDWTTDNKRKIREMKEKIENLKIYFFFRFEAKGFKLVAIRMMRPGQKHLEEHYADLSKRPFFSGLVKCEMTKL